MTCGVTLEAHEPGLSLTQMPPDGTVRRARWAEQVRQTRLSRQALGSDPNIFSVSDATWGLLCSGLPYSLTVWKVSMDTAMFGFQAILNIQFKYWVGTTAEVQDQYLSI